MQACRSIDGVLWRRAVGCCNNHGWCCWGGTAGLVMPTGDAGALRCAALWQVGTWDGKKRYFAAPPRIPKLGAGGGAGAPAEIGSPGQRYII